MQLVKYLILWLMICLYTSCNNLNEPIEIDPKEEENNQPIQSDEIIFPASDTTNNIKVIFSQLDSMGHKVGELGTFDVQIANSISLDGCLEGKFVSNTSNLGISFRNLGGNLGKTIVVFIIIYDNINNKIIDSGVKNVLVSSSSNTLNKINMRTTEPIFSGTLYSFFVDGIGDKPDAPVQISLSSKTKYIKSFVLEPKNNISAKFALHIDGSRRQTFYDTGNRSLISFQHLITKNNNKKMPTPMFASFINDHWFGHTMQIFKSGDNYEATGGGYQFSGQVKRLDYYLFYIDL